MQTDDAAISPGRARGERTVSDGGGRPSLIALLSGIAQDSQYLMRAELALARKEIGGALDEAKTGMAGMALGAAVTLAGVGALVAAAILALALVVEAWLAALIVGVVLLIVGLISLNSGKKRLNPEAFKPRRILESVGKDAAAVRRAI